MYYHLQGELLFIFSVSVDRHSVFYPCLLGLGVRISYFLCGEVSFMFSLSRYFHLRYQPIVG